MIYLRHYPGSDLLFRANERIDKSDSGCCILPSALLNIATIKMSAFFFRVASHRFNPISYFDNSGCV